MRRVGNRALWIGHFGDTRDARRLLDAGIEAVVELADSEAMAVLPRELIRCRFPLSDGGDNPLWLLRLSAETVAALLKAGVPTLICCSGGMSRSLCVAAGGIAVAEERPLDETMAETADGGPSDVSPGLYAELQKALSCV